MLPLTGPLAHRGGTPEPGRGRPHGGPSPSGLWWDVLETSWSDRSCNRSVEVDGNRTRNTRVIQPGALPLSYHDLTPPRFRSPARNTPGRSPEGEAGCAAGPTASVACLKIEWAAGWPPRETPVGVEPTSTGLQPVAWPSGSSVLCENVLARSRTWPSTFAESRALPHTPRTVIPRPGVEPEPAASKTAVPSATLAGNAPARSRTWSTTFGGSRANPSHSGGSGQVRSSRRPESNRHEPVYRTGASPFGHIGGWKQGCKDSNPVREFWRLAALPGAHPCRKILSRIILKSKKIGCPAGVEPGALRFTFSCASVTPRAPSNAALAAAEGAGFEPARLLARPRSRRVPSPVRVALPVIRETPRPGLEPGTPR